MGVDVQCGKWREEEERGERKTAARGAGEGRRDFVVRPAARLQLERIGSYDTSALFDDESGEQRLKEFYHSVLETQAEALDVDSLVAGRLLRAYEIFDMRGISLTQVNLATLRFARSVLTTFSMCYPETTCRAVIINMPPALRSPLRWIIEVYLAHPTLPSFLGPRVCELDASALRILDADDEAVVSHRCPRLTIEHEKIAT
ncbi:MAG: hypothetical protein SGPRY_012563 [Prymnesium sp.]